MYFNGGDYTALNGTNPLLLRGNQSIYSRNSDYSQPALTVERTHFLGGFQLDGNNKLSRIVLLSTPETSGSKGVTYNSNTSAISNANLLIENSRIGDPDHLFKIAIDLKGQSLNHLHDNEVFSNFQAVTAGNSSDVLIENSILNVIDSTQNASTTAVLAGSNSFVKLNNVQLDVTGNLNGSLTAFLTQIGTITANQVDIYTNNQWASSFAINNTGSGSFVSVSNSDLSINGQLDTRIFANDPNSLGVDITGSICQLNGSLVACM